MAEYTELRTGAPVVLSGHTFYPGNVYLSIPFIEARTTDLIRGTATARGFTNVMIAMASSDLSSSRSTSDKWMDTINYFGYTVNYADFNAPVPWR
jgi:hypothetical protein